MAARPTCFAVLFTVVIAAPAGAQSPIDYLVRIADPNTGFFHVEATVPATGAETLVSLPAWTPGFYAITDYSHDLFGEPPYERYTTFMYLHSGQAKPRDRWRSLA